MRRSILITGGAGFIGLNLVYYLLEMNDGDVTIFDSLTYAANRRELEKLKEEPRVQFIEGDVTKQAEVEQLFQRSYDVVVHLAAETHVDRSIAKAKPFLDTNMIGTYHLLEQVRQGRCGLLLHMSTDEVYGSLESTTEPLTEEALLRPGNPYAASKAGADLLIHSYVQTFSLPVIIMRAANNYGRYQHAEKLIPKVIVHALENKTIPLYGDGAHRRQWLHVRDHCMAIVNIMKKGVPGDIYHIGGTREYTNLETVKRILHLLGKNEKLISFVEDRKGHDRRYALSSEKLKKQLGWQPVTSFEQGLEDTALWYRNQWRKGAFR
ncbi:dTDP-glucose 4,6-dehydratase [Halalkalibacter oceani]|uniref:dTDP-glucose 4,6-dehydratase n=1 Tax=Halalkalibacter oceani TaxID=1653776 RepID=A0A9X2DRX9_9BACI|nr:dTDP-glucose 4,6-dehydratase [Halalkalibacter oceani]MCM3715576.1 dTDP-glucose 4,6-dehydratase [Halalkalibacter oceani]